MEGETNPVVRRITIETCAKEHERMREYGFTRCPVCLEELKQQSPEKREETEETCTIR